MLVRLIGELREIGLGETARLHLGNTLLHDLGAAVGGVVLDGEYRIGKTHTIQGATLVGFDEQSSKVFSIHQTLGSDFNPYHRIMMAKLSPTSPQQQVLTTEMPVREWERSEFANEFARPAGLDHFVGSVRMLGGFRGEGAGFMREKSDAAFTDEDREVLSIVIAESPRFFGDPLRKLSPRVRQTLEEVLLGRSDKEIAVKLNLSPHTVHQYVKDLFRHYRVHSRVELMAKVSASR